MCDAPSPMDPRELRTQLAEIESQCEHDFAPRPGSEHWLSETKKPGVYYAGHLNDAFESHISVPHECTKCGLERRIPISECCPMDGKPVEGTWATDERFEDYLKQDPGFNYSLYGFQCICGFNARGIAWDR